jgi:hypothetical protein
VVAPAIVVSTPSKATTSEDLGSTAFSVLLASKPTADVTITLSVDKANEASLDTATLTFTPADFSTPRVVVVTGKDDDVVDGDVAYKVVFGAVTSQDKGYEGKKPADISLTNIDNDTPGLTISAPSSTRTTEQGGKVTFTVRLKSKPAADVTVPVVSDKVTEGTVDKAQLSGRVAPGRCLPGAPTDPDVQISRIRLFETRLRYAPAIRSSCVEMGSEPDVSSIFPSHGSMSRRTLRSTGSLGPVPPLRHYYGALRRPARPARLRLRSPSAVPSFDGADGNSQVPRRPSPRVLRLFDPGGISGAGLRDNVPTCRSFDVAFRAYGLVGFHHLDISGPHSAACVLAVYASRLGSPRTSRKTRFRLAALPWSGGSSTR